MITCPSCGRHSSGARFCPNCRYQFTDPATLSDKAHIEQVRQAVHLRRYHQAKGKKIIVLVFCTFGCILGLLIWGGNLGQSPTHIGRTSSFAASRIALGENEVSVLSALGEPDINTKSLSSSPRYGWVYYTDTGGSISIGFTQGEVTTIDVLDPHGNPISETGNVPAPN